MRLGVPLIAGLEQVLQLRGLGVIPTLLMADGRPIPRYRLRKNAT
jgi:hypothetical protein